MCGLLRKEVWPGCVPLSSDCSVETLIHDMNRFSIYKKNLPWWSPSGDGQTATTSCSACLQTRRTSLHGLTSEAMVFKDFSTLIFCLAKTSCWWLRILPHLKPQWDDSYKSKIAPVHAVSGGVAPLILNLFTKIEVSVHLHGPAALLPRWRLDEPHVRFGHIGDKSRFSRHFLVRSAGVFITALPLGYL